MLGAIIGDIIGSYYEVLEVRYLKQHHKPRPYSERIKIMDQNTELFTDKCSCTDDSILTCAIADAVLNRDSNYEKYLKEYGLRELDLGNDKYNRGRFGKDFVEWLQGDYKGESYGNGSAMRVSAIGYLDTFEEVIIESWAATMPSHGHKESIIAAESVATSIFLLRNGCSKEELRDYIILNYYNLDYDLEQLRHNYTFSSRSSNSVPQALFVFLESDSFEDSIRKAISIGGDSDTIAAIVGSLSEAYYGIDENLYEQAKPYIKDYMIPVINKFYERNKEKCIRM